MRILLILFVASALVLSACGRAQNLIEAKTTMTFVNQDDQSQVLELHANAKKSVVLAIGHWLGIEKSITKAGSYTFNTSRGISRGTFNWLDPERVITFRPDPSGGEKDWSTSLQPDGSLLDQSGAIWRERTVRVTVARAQ